jgi:creatinine amidohydrolase/Fe(II)-dependent formamide hydrolase-like protein
LHVKVRVRDLNWMQLEAYLRGDDRIVLPVGSTEQHAYLSLETDNILAERASVEAAEPLGIPVLPALPYGVTGFTAYPGSPRSGSPHWSRSSRTSSIRWSARGSRGSSL